MRFSFAVCAALLVAVVAGKKKDAKDCETCTAIIGKVEQMLKEEKKKNKKLNGAAYIEKAIDDLCDKVTKQHEKKVCYYLKPIKREVSQPLSNFMPADRVCKKLKKNAPEICQVREGIKIEKGVTDYSKMKIRDLKRILMDRQTDCPNCLEKQEFVQRCKDTEHLVKDEL